ncbi:MAG TPA: GDSL-type esterase/lipase family protein [Xanthobacteraceae bacterium]|jgi:hypothetical protein|nr:GDSL-type esterase/lipase family protein [Xanthobacteraceae bacterium]
MRKKTAMARRFTGLVLLAALEILAAGVLFAVSVPPAAAQWGFGGFFGQPGPRRQQGYGWPWQQQEPRREAPVDYSRAPPPHKREAPATTNVLVLGDSMADWLGYGLEDAFSETPEIGVIRKPRANRGLIKTEGREAYDVVAAVREILAGEKPDYIVMMIGLADRTSIRERPRPATPTNPAAKQPPGQAQPAQQAAKPAAPPPAPTGDAEAGGEEPAIIAPAPEPTPSGSTTHPFRSDKWAELYAKRIDETIAALKSKGVPVLWVGLPAIRGTRSTADMVYLNDLYRDRAGKAGIAYVDIWDGFVDENGSYVNQGPDFEGQIRRLRAGDGVHFTKAGARKLAHYVEREIRRVMLTRGTPVATPIPTEKEAPPVPGKPGAPARPVAGPVVPLTGPAAAGSDGLLGGGPARATTSDPVTSRVLVKGDPVVAPTGRADNFAWPRPDSAPPSTSVTEPPEPAAAAPAPPEATKAAPPAKAAPPKRRAVQSPPPGQGGFFSRDDQPRPPGSVPRTNNGGGWWSGWR